MYCVGLTGTIASGKSTALNCFAELGINTFSADAVARQITNTNSNVLLALRHHFGDRIFLPSGELNRRALRTIIFSNPIQRQWLEKLLHPLIKQQLQDEIQHVNSQYCVIEIPLLFNRHDFPYINRILLITADESTKLSRIMARDQCSQGDAMAILKAQPSEDFRKSIADDLVINETTADSLRQSIHELHQHYLMFKS